MAVFTRYLLKHIEYAAKHHYRDNLILYLIPNPHVKQNVSQDRTPLFLQI